MIVVLTVRVCVQAISYRTWIVATIQFVRLTNTRIYEMEMFRKTILRPIETMVT